MLERRWLSNHFDDQRTIVTSTTWSSCTTRQNLLALETAGVTVLGLGTYLSWQITFEVVAMT